jgi:hypothetical protein
MLNVTFLTFRHFLEKFHVFLFCSKDFIIIIERLSVHFFLAVLGKGWLGMIHRPVIGLPEFCLTLCLVGLFQFRQRRVIESAKLLLSFSGLLPDRS